MLMKFFVLIKLKLSPPSFLRGVFFTVYQFIFSTKLKHMHKSTYRSNAEIVGGSARNSNSGGGSLGTGGSTIATGVCCIRGLG